jgi:hypothetical protein
MQLLEESFRILNSEDIRKLYGADNAWDVIEEVLTRYFKERLSTSPRQRMAIAGREVIRWLASPHILQTSRAQFEALLLEVAEHAEEWLMSAETTGAVEPRRRSGRGAAARVLPMERGEESDGRRAAAGGD